MKRLTVLRKKLKKHLTVRTLSFIMAAGLLLLAVPFVALASGKEQPEPGKKGDFSLFRDLFAVSQITLAEDAETAPIVYTGVRDAQSYQWQAYSVEKERYVDIQGQSGTQIEITVDLASQYDDGSGRSYFRCIATDADGNPLISDVLTVVLAVSQADESEASGTEETTPTISTIEIFEPTKPGETTEATTEPSEPTTEPTKETTEPAEETTEPTNETTEPAKETTEPATEPTNPADGGDGKVAPADGESLRGMLLQPMDDGTDDEGENEPELITGMFLRSLAEPTRATVSQYTVVYYLQKPELNLTDGDSNPADYEYYTSKTTSTPPQNMTSPTQLNTGFDSYLEYNAANAALSDTEGTLSDDGSTMIYTVYISRKTYTITFHRYYWYYYTSNVSAIKLTDRRGVVHTVSQQSPYLLQAKYGEDLNGLWPANDLLSENPQMLQYVLGSNNIWVSYYAAPVALDSTFLSKNVLEFDMIWANSVNENRVANFYIQVLDEELADGEEPDATRNGVNYKLKQTLKSSSTSLFTNCENTTFEGCRRVSFDRNGNTRGYYFIRNRYTVSYISNGGTRVRSTSYRFDQKLTAPSEPTKSDYHFGGWYYDAALSVPVAWGTDKMPSRNITLYAKWDHSITFNNTNEPVVYAVKDQNLEGLIPSDPTPDDAHATGYEFEGWYSDPELTNPYTFPSTMPDDDIVVYANWIPDVAEYTLTVNKNNGTADDTFTVASGNMLSTAGITQPTRTGYNFEGWYTDAGFASGTKIADLSTYSMPENDLTIYANWTAKNYTLTVHKNNGDTPDTQTFTVAYNTALSNVGITQPTRTGYNFEGWYTDPGFADGTKIADLSAYHMPAANLDIYANWTVKNYTLTVYKNNGDTPDTQTFTVAYNTALSNVGITQPTRTGYNFEGWYTDPDFADGTKIADLSAYPMPENDLNIYARWEINKHTVTVKFMDATNNDIATKTYNDIPYGEPIFDTVPTAPVPDGDESYEFHHWLDAGGMLDPELTDHSKTMPDSDLTIKAYLVKKKFTVTVKQQYEDATALETISNVVYGSKITKKTAYTDAESREGYTFNGCWYYKDSTGSEAEFEFGVTEVRDNITIYTAYWIENQLEVKNDGNDNVFLIYGGGISLSVFVPAGGSVTVRQLPYATYTVSSQGWDFENSFAPATVSLDADAVRNAASNVLTAEPAVTASGPFYWLRGYAKVLG